MERKLRIGIVIASVRTNRLGEKIARWFLGVAGQHAALEPVLLDLRDYAISNYEEPRMPSIAAADWPQEGQRRWAETVAQLDGFVIVTPEYNHGYPGSLKNALDHTYSGWNAKPVGFVSYGGGAAGVRAVEQLRLVCVELQMAPVRAEVNIPFAARNLDAAGAPADPMHEQKAQMLLRQMAWWGRALVEAREREPFPAR